MTAVLTVPGTHFQLPPDVIVLGLIAGLSYSLLGLGLTLTYRTSRVINFAHGEIGALAAVLVPVLVVNHRWSYWAAIPTALAVGAAGGAAMQLFVIRRLDRSPRLVVLVATIAAAQLFFLGQALIPKVGKMAGAPYPTPFTADVRVGSLHLRAGQLMILVLVPVVTTGLSAFLRHTKVGLGARAAAENDSAARLAGVPVDRVSLVMWVVAGLLAAASAVLLGPTHPVLTQQALGPQLLARALAAAMIGGLTSFSGVFAGGIVIGIVEALVVWNYPTSGVVELVVLLIIVGSLLLRRGLGQLARGGVETSWSLGGGVARIEAAVARHPRVRRAKVVGLTALVAICALGVLAFSSAQTSLLSSVVVFAIVGLSLVVLTGFAGQVSLGQFAFVTIGALVAGRLHQLGYPGWVAPLYAAGAGGVAALLVGLPALRIRGLYLAVTTLAFAVVTSTWLFSQRWLVNTSATSTSLELPRSRLFGLDLRDEHHYFWLCLAVLVLTAAAVARLRATGIGRAMIAVRDNEPSAATVGVPPWRVKLTAFVLSGVIAGLAGWLYGGLLVDFAGPTQPGLLGPEVSLTALAMVVFGGVTTITGAVVGALWVQGIPYLFGTKAGYLSSGLGVLLVLLLLPGGLGSAVLAAVHRLARRLAGDGVAPTAGTVAAPTAGTVAAAAAGTVAEVMRARPRLEPARTEPARPSTAPALAANGITVSFGGNVAVGGVDLWAAPGEIVGLIGPNGAGKTTLFDVLSGQLRPNTGRVFLEGRDVTASTPDVRARLGLGRTFQQARLFDELTVQDAFKVALECGEPSEVVPSLLGLPPSRAAERRKELRSAELVELLGLQAVAGRRVSDLSTGTRRLAELGCVVALGARVVLLDEPTAGIAQREVESFRPVLREIRDHLGATMVVIEHDIPLVVSLVDRLYALAAGQVIAEGEPAAVRDDPAVVAAYLGTDERLVRRSGRAAPARRRKTEVKT